MKMLPAATTIVGVGDIMLGRGLADSKIKDFDFLLEPKLISALQGDLVTANLECILGEVGAPNPISHAHFRTSPERAISLLRRFHVVNLANNHIFDFGEEGVESTLYQKELKVRSITLVQWVYVRLVLGKRLKKHTLRFEFKAMIA